MIVPLIDTPMLKTLRSKQPAKVYRFWGAEGKRSGTKIHENMQRREGRPHSPQIDRLWVLGEEKQSLHLFGNEPTPPLDLPHGASRQILWNGLQCVSSSVESRCIVTSQELCCDLWGRDDGSNQESEVCRDFSFLPSFPISQKTRHIYHSVSKTDKFPSCKHISSHVRIHTKNKNILFFLIY